MLSRSESTSPYFNSPILPKELLKRVRQLEDKLDVFNIRIQRQLAESDLAKEQRQREELKQQQKQQVIVVQKIIPRIFDTNIKTL